MLWAARARGVCGAAWRLWRGVAALVFHDELGRSSTSPGPACFGLPLLWQPWGGESSGPASGVGPDRLGVLLGPPAAVGRQEAPALSAHFPGAGLRAAAGPDRTETTNVVLCQAGRDFACVPLVRAESTALLGVEHKKVAVTLWVAVSGCPGE